MGQVFFQKFVLPIVATKLNQIHFWYFALHCLMAKVEFRVCGLRAEVMYMKCKLKHDLGLVRTPYFSCAEPNWISSSLKRNSRDIWFRRRTVYRAWIKFDKSSTDSVELNAFFCRTKLKLPYQTDSDAALLPYLIHHLGSAHEWTGVWNGPYWVQTGRLTGSFESSSWYLV